MTSESTKYLLDTSAWIEFFLGTKKGVVVQEILSAQNTIITTSSSLAEIYDWTLKENKDFAPAVELVRRKSKIIELTLNDWLIATHNRRIQRVEKPKIGIMDCLLLAVQEYSSATIVTKDNDFRGLPNTIML